LPTYKDWVRKSRTDTHIEKDEDDDAPEGNNNQRQQYNKVNKLQVMGGGDFRRSK